MITALKIEIFGFKKGTSDLFLENSGGIKITIIQKSQKVVYYVLKEGNSQTFGRKKNSPFFLLNFRLFCDN